MHKTAGFIGRWEQFYVNEDGVDYPIEDNGVGTVTEIKGANFTVRSSEGIILLEGTFQFNLEVTPPTIDWKYATGIDKGKTFLAIYNVIKNEFVFAASDEGMARPESFKPQKGHTIRKFRRKIG